MPALDMPINEMEQYLGSGIKPKDFDEYWDKQIKEVDEMNLEYIITQKEFNNKKAKYYEIIFKGIDGAKIYAKYICPNHDCKVPTVLEFHDYKQASRGWYHLTRYIALDYAVLAMDCRGQGGKSEDLGGAKGSTVCGHLINGIDDEVDKLYYNKIYLDGYILSKIAEEIPNTDKNKMIAFGKGQGGAIALVTSIFNSNIKKCSLQYPFLSDFKRVWDMDLDIEAYEGIRYYFRWFDPLHIREKEIFEKLGYIDAVNFASKLKCELLVGTGLLDNICPPSTQYAIFNNAKCEKRHVVFPKYGHELINFFEDENLKFIKF
jgi:cephalosporin-C deacetylase